MYLCQVTQIFDKFLKEETRSRVSILHVLPRTQGFDKENLFDVYCVMCRLLLPA